jgi:hypothetical protein
MSAFILSAPIPVGVSKTPFFMSLGTDQIVATYSYFTMTVTLPGPTAGQIVSLVFGNTTVTFTVAASPDQSGSQIPAYVSGTLVSYLDTLITWFNKNETILDNFILSTTGSAVVFTLRQSGVVVISYTETLSNVTIVATNASTPTVPVGLSALAKIYRKDIPSGETLLATLNIPFDASNSSAVFDLHRVFALEPHLPTTASIPSLHTGMATKSFNRYFVRYGERKGNPAVSNALTTTTDYSIIYGGLAGVRFGFYPTSDNIFACHNFRKSDLNGLVIPVSKEQPNWLYFFVKQSLYLGYLYYYRIVVTWSDTTQTVHDLEPLVPENKTMYWISCGYNQLDLGSLTPPSPGAEILRYDCYIKESTTLLQYYLGTYEVSCEVYPWNTYLLLDNGFGGLESVWCRGKIKTIYNADRETARRGVWTDSSGSVGDIIPIESEGYTQLEINTGWHDVEYMQHLRQLLLGEIWVIDINTNIFVKAAMETKNFEIVESDQELFSLNFVLKIASYDAGAQFT